MRKSALAPPSLAERFEIEVHADCFERALAVGCNPVVEDYLCDEPRLRSLLLVELLLIEIEWRVKRMSNCRVRRATVSFNALPTDQLDAGLERQ